jgi:deoxycytidylate deaminase
MVEIGAQYASGILKRRAIRNEAAAAIAVRAEFIIAGQPNGVRERDGRGIVERKRVERKAIGRTPA